MHQAYVTGSPVVQTEINSANRNWSTGIMTASKGRLQQRVKMEAGLCESFVNFKMPTTALTHFRYCNECTQEEQKRDGRQHYQNERVVAA